MTTMQFLPLDDISPEAFLPLMNKPTTRAHLVEHAPFDAVSIGQWLDDKQQMNLKPGCRVRAIEVDGRLSGWCGIQREQDQYEVAIILDDSVWGIGQAVFAEMMIWARELGHEVVHIHFHHSRPESRFLTRMARRVYQSEVMGERFVSYELVVPE